MGDGPRALGRHRLVRRHHPAASDRESNDEAGRRRVGRQRAPPATAGSKDTVSPSFTGVSSEPR